MDLPLKTDVQCLHRWQKVLNPDLVRARRTLHRRACSSTARPSAPSAAPDPLVVASGLQVKGPWKQEEDDKVRDLVAIHGPKKWSLIASQLPGRIGKQCRERWHNHLNPDIRKEPWTPGEEETLLRAHATHGNRWAEIAKLLNGRTDNAIKSEQSLAVAQKTPPLAHNSATNRLTPRCFCRPLELQPEKAGAGVVREERQAQVAGGGEGRSRGPGRRYAEPADVSR